MRVSVLTSSRADYGIYLPLLKRLQSDVFFDLNIIAFGTHMSEKYGFTLSSILDDGFNIGYEIENLIGDTPKEVSLSMAKTVELFSTVWEKEKGKTDLIVCLGDRFEMFAAVTASIPFNIPIAHIHGGETTLGAIDNVFRHSITLMSKYHFTSTETHYARVKELIGVDDNVFNVGSLSLDNLNGFKFLSIEEFESIFNVDLSIPTILVTFHPETVSFEKNIDYSKIICNVLNDLEGFQILITLPNADTMGSVIREDFLNLSKMNKNIFVKENLGLKGYFSAMKFCKFMLGNTSSGIIEAASFGKYVINLGNRQKGRSFSGNIINVDIDKVEMKKAIENISLKGEFLGDNIYRNQAFASDLAINILKSI